MINDSLHELARACCAAEIEARALAAVRKLLAGHVLNFRDKGDLSSSGAAKSHELHQLLNLHTDFDPTRIDRALAEEIAERCKERLVTALARVSASQRDL